MNRLRDVSTGLYLFLDQPRTLKLFQPLKAGKLQSLDFSKEYQDV